MKKEIVIDGNSFSDRSGLTLEIRRKFTKGVAWVDYNHADGINLDSINDFLSGGFGITEYEEPIKVKWIQSTKSKKDLGKEETIAYLQDKLKKCHPSNIEYVKKDIDLAKADEGPWLFDLIIEIIRSQNHIELSLE